MGKLTAIAVKSAKAGRHQDGNGLMLLVKPTGSRSWQLRVQADGKRRDFGLGSATTVTLAEARQKAEQVRKLYKSGIDPVAKRKAERLAQAEIPTFRQAAEAAHEELVSGWRNAKHRADWISSLKAYAFPHIGAVRIDLVDAPMVRDLLFPIWLSKAETARRVRQRVRAVIDWAIAKGFRPSLDLSGVGKGLPKQPKTDNHFRAMPYERLPAFVESTRDKKETMGRSALQFAILTAARSGEVRGATWKEINLKNKEWTIPAERMKPGKEHVVPLSESAIRLLKWASQFGTDVLRDAQEPFDVHGFRSSFKVWAVECTHYPDGVSEVALSHLDDNKVRAAYRRTDFRKLRTQMMEDWAAYIEKGASIGGAETEDDQL